MLQSGRKLPDLAFTVKILNLLCAPVFSLSAKLVEHSAGRAVDLSFLQRSRLIGDTR